MTKPLISRHLSQSALSLAVALAAVVAGVPIAGCGSSHDDLILQAARRDRPTSQNEDQGAEDASTSTESQGGDSDADSSADSGSQYASETDSGSNHSGSENSSDSKKKPEASWNLSTIDQRRPEEPLPNQQQRARAYQNLTAIAEALGKYYEDQDRYPKPFTKAAGGFDGLSWRVELLPYLGYQGLYQRFDFTKPWDQEPNKSLLKYIPPEYVSPERFDVKTNYLLPAHRNFLFGENKARAKFQIEDGPESTILLVEAADSQAVEWTSPQDFSPEDTDIRDDLSGLRQDGVFAVWANGVPVMLSKKLSSQQLWDALTYESGDGQVAGDVHQDISVPLRAGADAEQVATETSDSSADTTVETEKPQDRELTASRHRWDVPSTAEIAQAQQRLREIFAAELSEADTRASRLELAQQMVQQAKMMSQDHAGAYVLQTAALRVASSAGGWKELLKAVESRSAQFDVDPYEVNVSALLDFGETAVEQKRKRSFGDNLDYAKRAVKILHQGVLRDDYARAARLAGHAARFTDTGPLKALSKEFSRLRFLFESSQRQYTDANEQMAKFREDSSDPEAAAAVGRFLCFIKEDWQQGLPLLSRSSNPSLQQAVALDRQGARDPSEQVAIADAWWQLAMQTPGPKFRQGTLDRAAYWYRLALPKLPESLDKIHAKARLKRLGQAEPVTPQSALRQIADSLDVDLAAAGAMLTTRSSMD